MDTLKLKTFFLHPILSENQIDIYNASNSVIVSHTLFQNITEKDAKGNVAIIGLYYNNKKIYVDIIDSHDEESNFMYVPMWIYTYFNYQEDDLVNYMQVFPKTGNKIKIKPKGDFYAYLDDPVNALRNGFEKYSCLIENTTILLNVESIPLEVEILETYINSEKNMKNQPICIRGIELEVDIAVQESVQETVPEPVPDTVPDTVPEPTNNINDFSSMLPASMISESMFSTSMFPETNQTSKKFPGKGYSLT